jgi:N utilization substance protein B
MSNQPDPRHVARALAMQHLFTALVSQQQAFPLAELLAEMEVKSYDKNIYTQIVEGVSTTQAELDEQIKALAPAWPIDQIAPVDLTLLRMGIWEGFVGKITPAKVVINEIVELAKRFGGESTSGFVNGVLGKLYQQLEANND